MLTELDPRAAPTDRTSRPGRRLVAAALGLVCLVLVLVFCCFVAPAWATSNYPPGRALSIPQAYISLGLVVWGALAGAWLQAPGAAYRRAFPAALVIASLALTLLGPLQSVVNQSINLDPTP